MKAALSALALAAVAAPALAGVLVSSNGNPVKRLAWQPVCALRAQKYRLNFS